MARDQDSGSINGSHIKLGPFKVSHRGCGDSLKRPDCNVWRPGLSPDAIWVMGRSNHCSKLSQEFQGPLIN